MGSLAMDAGGGERVFCWTRRSTNIGRDQSALACGCAQAMWTAVIRSLSAIS